jgi:hypothetical protein
MLLRVLLPLLAGGVGELQSWDLLPIFRSTPSAPTMN